MSSKGFTIVELLIVVVVIAILAAITVVSYNGIKSQAERAATQSAIEQATKKILTYKVMSGSLPSSLDQLNDGNGLATGGSTRYAYTVEDDQFCLTAATPDLRYTYYIEHEGAPVKEGACEGHLAILTGFPSRGGSTNITYLTASGGGDFMRAPIGDIPVGAWMMVIMAYTNPADPIPPAGWTTIVPRHTAGTLGASIYAKIKQAGDSDDQLFDGPGTSGSGTSNGALLWGRNAAAVGTWTIGTFGDRAANATTTTVVAPPLTVSGSGALVLSIALERTILDEANYTSMTGATPWVWVPQAGDTNKLQSIAVGYNEQTAPGVSQAMTVTYPNPHASNGIGLQIAIPPAS